MQSLTNVLSKVKSMGSKVYALSPFGVGLALGYFCKPEIKAAADLAMKLAHLVINHL